MNRLTHGAAALLVVLLISTFIGGCSSVPESLPSQTGEISPTEGRDDLAALFDETQALVGGDWTVKDESTPFECEVAGGGNGVQFLLTRTGSAPGSMENAETFARSVSNYFESRGYPSNTSFHDDLGYDVRGESPQRSVITFGANGKAMSLQGGSACVPGDIDGVRNATSATEARDDLAELFDESQALVLGDWQNSDQVTPFECKTSGKEKGVQFLLSRIRTSPGSMDDAKTVADKIAALWQANGYPAAIAYQDGLGYRVNAQNSERSVITFAANNYAMTLGGGSPCVAGDRDEVRSEVDSQG